MFNFFIKSEFYNSCVEESHSYPWKSLRDWAHRVPILDFGIWDKLVEELTVNLNSRVADIRASPDTNIRRWSQRQPSSSRSQLSEILPFASTESGKNGENPFTSPAPGENCSRRNRERHKFHERSRLTYSASHFPLSSYYSRKTAAQIVEPYTISIVRSSILQL